jgi:hypothetical protein
MLFTKAVEFVSSDVNLHGRSGRVAFPRTNWVPARPARETVGAVALAAERRADVRRSVVFMMLAIDVLRSIGLQVDVMVLWK